MTSTATSAATDPRPPYTPRHASDDFPADSARDTAFELLGRQPCGHWRRDAFDLFMDVSPAKRGRHHAPEPEPQVKLVDDFLWMRGAYLASRTGAELPGAWDGCAISFLGILGLWS
jgi:hypothetical protein